MPDFSEILKIAVEQQDWQLICGLYTNITGEPLSVPDNVGEEETGNDEVLNKEYSVDELKYQNQLSPQEQDPELVDKDIDKLISSRYNDFTAPPRGASKTDSSGRKMRAEPVGSSLLKNVVGVSEEPFIDNMTDSLLDPETGEKLVGNNKNAKITPRNRRKELGMKNTSTVNAVCASCGVEQKTSSELLYGYSKIESQNTWKCNDCTTKRGHGGRDR
jgi:hypothetical protein